MELVLGVAQKHVALYSSIEAGEVAAAAAHPGDGTAVLGAACDEFGGEVDVSVEDDGVDAAQGEDFSAGGLGEVNSQAVLFEAEVGSLCLYVEGVEEFGGHSSSWSSAR